MNHVRIGGGGGGGSQSITFYTAPKYLENIVEIFLESIVKLPKYFETYPQYCWNIVIILLCPHNIKRMQYFPNIIKTSKCINNSFFLNEWYQKLRLDLDIHYENTNSIL